jgi:hypothetical protein
VGRKMNSLMKTSDFLRSTNFILLNYWPKYENIQSILNLIRSSCLSGRPLSLRVSKAKKPRYATAATMFRGSF